MNPTASQQTQAQLPICRMAIWHTTHSFHSGARWWSTGRAEKPWEKWFLETSQFCQ